jgi:formylglycine-generating enzyme required for sulfatase activity
MAASSTGEKLKVFISYSRRDSTEFVDELVAGLDLAGFAPFLDRHNVAAGEKWEERLGGLIAQADTVVFVVSPEAVKSERCAWEVERALARTKRVLPVVFKPVPESEIPEELRSRQFVLFGAGAGFARPLGQLAEALRQDIGWIREHTRLSDLAARWEARGRPEALLLRGDDLAAAEAWIKRSNPDAFRITEAVRDFIASSKKAEAAFFDSASAARRRVRRSRILMGVLFAVVVAVLAGWWEQDWLRKHLYVWTNVNVLAAAQEQSLKPGQSFKECTDCPEMIVVPAGSFLMGSPEGHGRSNEHPQHNVTIAKPFAVAKFELTFSEWDACETQGGCPHARDNDWGRGRQPVINVDWDDAKQYVRWLSTITGKNYRLLSEAEYEYAARGGGQTEYPWGDNLKLNGTAMADCLECVSLEFRVSHQLVKKLIAPVGLFPPNKFGLYDMVGNVLEWTEDCDHSDYDGAPANGAAWVKGSCIFRVVRGNDLILTDVGLRSAFRGLPQPVASRTPFLGFRVARTLAAAVTIAPGAR